jgi:murein DD-endopeptidase MepM/ murein hydrolase activator NlpD
MRKQILVLAFVAGLVLVLAAPASAESLSTLRTRRDVAHAKRVQLAAKLDTLRASDRQLTAAVQTLDAAVRTSSSQADAASRAALGAQNALVAAQARLDATTKQVQQLRASVARRAIVAYMAPASDDSVVGLLQSSDLGDLSRRRALLTQVIGSERDLIDQLRAAREDQTAERAALAHARDLARARLQDATARLQSLADSRNAQARLRSALENRIHAYNDEANALVKEEAGVESLIRAKEAAARASRGGDGFVDGRVSGAGLIWPVHGPVTSPFGPRWGGFHPGIDIGVGYGTPIHAAKAGVVIFAGWNGGYGNFVIIDHGGGFATAYAHQSQIAVSDGQQVAQGQVIGYVGSTGHSTGPHLHFETRVNGTPRNPMNYLP